MNEGIALAPTMTRRGTQGDPMATEVFAGRKGLFAEPIATIEGDEVFAGRKGMFAEPIATVEGDEVFAGRKGMFDEPIATIDGDEVFAGRKGMFAEPIATIEGDEIFAGRKGVFDEPIATIEGEESLAGVAGAVVVLLLDVESTGDGESGASASEDSDSADSEPSDEDTSTSSPSYYSGGSASSSSDSGMVVAIGVVVVAVLLFAAASEDDQARPMTGQAPAAPAPSASAPVTPVECSPESLWLNSVAFLEQLREQLDTAPRQDAYESESEYLARRAGVALNATRVLDASAQAWPEMIISLAVTGRRYDPEGETLQIESGDTLALPGTSDYLALPCRLGPLLVCDTRRSGQGGVLTVARTSVTLPRDSARALDVNERPLRVVARVRFGSMAYNAGGMFPHRLAAGLIAVESELRTGTDELVARLDGPSAGLVPQTGVFLLPVPGLDAPSAPPVQSVHWSFDFWRIHEFSARRAGTACNQRF